MTRRRSNGEVVPGLAARIRDVRLAAGLTQAKLAERADMKVETLSRVETAATTPDLDTLVRIARGIGVPLGTLFALDTSPANAVEQGILERLRGLREVDRLAVFALVESLALLAVTLASRGPSRVADE